MEQARSAGRGVVEFGRPLLKLYSLTHTAQHRTGRYFFVSYWTSFLTSLPGQTAFFAFFPLRSFAQLRRWIDATLRRARGVSRRPHACIK